MKSKIYALYCGDEFITSGTVAAIAEKRGIKQDSVRYLTTPTYRKRCENRKHYRRGYLSLVELEDE